MKKLFVVLTIFFSSLNKTSAQSVSEICESIVIFTEKIGDSIQFKIYAPGANILGYYDPFSIGNLAIYTVKGDTLLEFTPYCGFPTSDLQEVLHLYECEYGNKEDYYVKFSFSYFWGTYELKIFANDKKELIEK